LVKIKKADLYLSPGGAGFGTFSDASGRRVAGQFIEPELSLPLSIKRAIFSCDYTLSNAAKKSMVSIHKFILQHSHILKNVGMLCRVYVCCFFQLLLVFFNLFFLSAGIVIVL
jgi:hypothetical protein